MVIENTKLRELLETLDTETSYLKQKQSISLEDYLSSWEIQHIVERAFEQAIQACIDISARLISIKKLPTADDYHGIFDVLLQQNIIPSEFLKRMHQMIGFRNALVHEYRHIKHEEVYRHLQENLSLFPEFAAHIIKFLS